MIIIKFCIIICIALPLLSGCRTRTPVNNDGTETADDEMPSDTVTETVTEAVTEDYYADAYNEALSLYESGNYKSAIFLFEWLVDYRDSAELMKKCEIAYLTDIAENSRYFSERIDAANDLYEYDKKTAAKIADAIMKDMDYASEEIINCGGWEKRLEQIFTLLNNEGYNNCFSEAAEKIVAQCTSETTRTEISNLLDISDYLVLNLIPPLIEKGWFDDRSNEDADESRFITDSCISIDYHVISYINKKPGIDSKLEAAYLIAEKFTPSVKSRYGTGGSEYSLTNSWAGCSIDFSSADASDIMPALSETVTAASPGSKYLIVCRNLNKGDESDGWYINFNLMMALPAENMPRSISEVTQLITVEFSWEYSFTFNNGITDSYSATASVNHYDFKTGNFIKHLTDEYFSAETIAFYFGDPPEIVYKEVSAGELAPVINKVLFGLGF
jgi:hypothetical protein